MAFPPATPPPNLSGYDPAASAPLSTNTVPAGDDGARLAQRRTLTPITLDPDDLNDLWSGVERSRQRVRKQEEAWNILLKEYLPIVKASGTPEVLKVNVHFRNVQTKIGQLFYRSPEIQCVPKGPAIESSVDPTTGVQKTPEEIIALKQAVLNWYLGADCINASRLMDESLFDILAWAGIAAWKIGYRATMKAFQQPVMRPDPTWQPPMMGLGLSPAAQPPMVQATNPDGSPQTQTIPVPIYEEWYMRRFSPMKVLFSDDLRSTRFDEEATWMGWDFAIPKNTAKREFALSDDEIHNMTDDERAFKHDDVQQNTRSQMVRGVELWRKASLYRPDAQPHPQALDHIVLIDGIKDYPVVCRPSPDQSFDAQGKLTPDSMIGFPIHIITIRDLADSPFPPSDSAFTNPQAKELNTTRRQNVMLRDRAIGKQFYDSSHLESGELDILKNGEVGELVGVKAGALAGGPERILANTAQPVSTPDDWRTAAMIKQDMEETLGISSQQLGTPSATVNSATADAIVNNAANGRMEKEQRRAVEGYIAGARKLDALIMRYATETQYVSVVGATGARQLVAWNNKLVSGRYSYDILPDSAWRMDSAQYLRQALSFYNLAAKDPLFNRVVVLRRIAQMLGYDPQQVIMTPEQIQQMQMQGQQQPPHGGAAQPVAAAEQQRTETTQNGPQSENGPSRIMGG